MMRVLVCGGRAFRDWGAMCAVLDSYPITHVIEGGAPGADCLAREWAHQNEIPCTSFSADWKRFGKKAGPIRNKRMIQEGSPDLVIAFPGGRGTADMVRRARAAGLRVIEIDPSQRDKSLNTQEIVK